MAKKTQSQRVLDKLIAEGSMTTVDAVSMFPAILRLSERIRELERMGWIIRHEKVPGKPYSRYVLGSEHPMKLKRVAKVELPPAFDKPIHSESLLL